ncbi:TlpA disulfide reductase family protein [Leeia oryzae]|uniref:TlpA disulfide reductase family protein n=1 Tax=Leeia oryzae TaxID=356662 RepID=UPI00037D820F|nr:TlpA disulfide reductase family protein [Leeia oryzae]
MKTPAAKSLTGMFILMLIMLALFAGVWVRQHRDSTPENPQGVAADMLWKTSLPDLKQQPQPFSQWRGKVVIVNFWASWCPPCREETPEFVQLQKEFGAQGVQFVGIALDTAANAQAFATQVGINYPVLLGESAGDQLMAQLGNTANALPYTLILDRNGMIRHVQLGQLSAKQLRPLLPSLIKS